MWFSRSGQDVGEQVGKSGSGRDGYWGGGGERALSLGNIKGQSWLVIGEGWGRAVFGLVLIPAGRWGDKRGLSQLCSFGRLPRQPTPLWA